MVCYRERIQSKISQGRKYAGQKPGKRKVQRSHCLFPLGSWMCSLSVCVEQMQHCQLGKSTWASWLSLIKVPWLRHGSLCDWSQSPAPLASWCCVTQSLCPISPCWSVGRGQPPPEVLFAVLSNTQLHACTTQLGYQHNPWPPCKQRHSNDSTGTLSLKSGGQRPHLFGGKVKFFTIKVHILRIKCIHLKYMFQWVLANVYVCIAITKTKIKDISITLESSLMFPCSHLPSALDFPFLEFWIHIQWNLTVFISWRVSSFIQHVLEIVVCP